MERATTWLSLRPTVQEERGSPPTRRLTTFVSDDDITIKYVDIKATCSVIMHDWSEWAPEKTIVGKSIKCVQSVCVEYLHEAIPVQEGLSGDV